MPPCQNLHTHTTYCDGKSTAEEMILAALELGCDSIGFSGHSFVESIDELYSMSFETTRKYVGEIKALKDKYEGRIAVYLGIEQDYYSGTPGGVYDYVIGSAHLVEKNKLLLAVDHNARTVHQTVADHYGGDYYALAEDYYAVASGLGKATGADIIGHFDVVTKNNFDGSMFDLNHPRYVGPALDAMDEILKDCRLFEVNTGAMYRLGKIDPYPSPFLLRELKKRGGEVILASDSHDAPSLCHKFGEMRELLKACGFRYAKRLGENGFVDILL